MCMCFQFPLHSITTQVLWRIWGSTYHQGLYQGGPWDTCCQTQRLSVFDVSFIIMVLAKESCKWPFGSSLNILPSNILDPGVPAVQTTQDSDWWIFNHLKTNIVTFFYVTTGYGNEIVERAWLHNVKVLCQIQSSGFWFLILGIRAILTIIPAW